MQTFLAPLLHTWKIAIQSVTYLWIGDRVSKYPSLGWCAVCRLGNNIIIPDTSASNGTTSIKTVALTSLDSGFQQSDTTTTPNRRVTCLMSAAWYARTSAGRMEQVLQRPVRPDTQGAPRRNRRVTRLMSAARYAPDFGRQDRTGSAASLHYHRPDTQGAPGRNRRVTHLMSSVWHAPLNADSGEQNKNGLCSVQSSVTWWRIAALATETSLSTTRHGVTWNNFLPSKYSRHVNKITFASPFSIFKK